METLQTIKEEIGQLEHLQRLLLTYESIAALYMRRTKNMVIDSRAFYEGLRSVYDEVLQAHHWEIEAIGKKRPFSKRLFHLLRGLQQKRNAAVLLSVNTGLYGDIIQRTLFSFIEYIKSTKTDCIIIGRRAKILFEELLPKTPYIYIEFPDTAIDVERILTASHLLSRYQQVRVFYGRFESFISQVPTDTLLGLEQQTSLIRKLQQSKKTPAVLYLFEPSLEEVTQFFETEIFTSLFQQLVEESHLSKLASRMFLLDNAAGRIHTMLTATDLKRQRTAHKIQNKKQLEAVHSRIAMGI